jgi:hypothetical protein
MLNYKWNKFYEAALYETNAQRIGDRITVALEMLAARLNMLQGPAGIPERVELVRCTGNLKRLKTRTSFDS